MSSKPDNTNSKETFGLFYALKHKCFFWGGREFLTFKTELVSNLKELYILSYPNIIHSKHKLLNVNTC